MTTAPSGLPRVNQIQTELGSFLLFATGDIISQSLYRQGTWEPWNLQISAILLAGLEQPVIADVGANLGAYAIPMARAVLPAGGQVIAFEPQRIIYYQLCGNIFLNGLGNCIPHKLAVAEQCRSMDLPLPDYSGELNIGGLSLDAEIRAQQRMMSTMATTRPSERVEIVTLDSMKLPRLSLLKIDAEGLEREVIEGALGTLEANRYPPILFECWTDQQASWFGDRRRKLFELLESTGYSWALLDSVGIAQHRDAERHFELMRAEDGSVRLERRR